MRGDAEPGLCRATSDHGQSPGADPERPTRPEGVFQFRVGDIRATAITNGRSVFPAAGVFGNPPAEERERALRERGQPTDLVESSLTSIVVETGRNRVLIDTGIGAFSPETGKLFPRLAAAGIDRADIDTGILTHGHPDQFAGTPAEAGRPAFPNARYVMRRGE